MSRCDPATATKPQGWGYSGVNARVIEVELLSMLGVKVVEVPDLDVEACYVRDRRVVLIRAGLPDEARRRAFDCVLVLPPKAA